MGSVNWKVIAAGALSGTLWFAALMAVGAVYSCARAHDAEHNSDFIGEDSIKNGMGQLCCGENDCAEVLPADIKEMADGLHIHVRAHFPEIQENAYLSITAQHAHEEEWEEIWAYKDIIPNPRNGKTYRCAWPSPHDRKCLIHGMPGS